MNELAAKETEFEAKIKGMDKLKVVFISAESEIVVAKHMHKQFLKMGHESHYINNLDTLINLLESEGHTESVGVYSSKGNPMSLRRYLTFAGFKIEELDMVFVEQNFMYFKNDIDTPVIYYHRDLWTECFMREPDMLLYRYANHFTALQYLSRYTWSNTAYKLQFINGVEMSEWKPDRKKRFKGLNYIYPRNTLESYLKRDFVQRDYYLPTYNVVEYLKSRDWVNLHGYHRTTREEYTWILENLEAIVFMPPNNAFLSRILYESAACKTLLVLYVPSDFAQKQYNQIGLVHGDNCLMARNMKQIMNVYVMGKRKIEKIVENAYGWVKRFHTYQSRAKLLEKIMYKLIENLGGKNAKKKIV